MTGSVYTEAVVHLAPEAFAAEAPYQTAIVTLDEGGRVTGRILGGRVSIGDRVELAETRDGVPFFRKAAAAGPGGRLRGGSERSPHPGPGGPAVPAEEDGFQEAS
ncbi:MAG: OB-fold domain-containing protein [Acidobacteria bacterium]|nr:OB-fold domain-containing protein [Acidobacteriota bacterium]